MVNCRYGAPRVWWPLWNIAGFVAALCVCVFVCVCVMGGILGNRTFLAIWALWRYPLLHVLTPKWWQSVDWFPRHAYRLAPHPTKSSPLLVLYYQQAFSLEMADHRQAVQPNHKLNIASNRLQGLFELKVLFCLRNLE